MGEGEQVSLRESLNTSLEILAEDPYLRVLLKQIPIVGDSLTEIAAGKGQQIIEARRDEFLRFLAEHLANLEEQAVKKDYFQTPEGFDLLIKALDESRKTRSAEKRGLYARILRGAVIDFDRKEYSAEEYLHVISDLTEQEVRVAFSVYRARPEPGEPWEKWGEGVCRELGIDKNDLPMMLSRIEARGLLVRVILMGEGDDLVFPEGPYYQVSPSFDRLERFLEL